MQLKSRVYRDIVENIYEGLYLTDTNRVITYWNKAAEEMTGFSADEVVGHACFDNILTHIDGEGNQLCFGRCPLAATMKDGALREAEVYLHHKDGHRVPVLVRAAPLKDEDGSLVGAIELFTDVSAKEADRLRVSELEQLAMLDPLTEIANRRYLERALSNSLDEWRRYQMPFGLLFVDIDQFKAFNDSHGHDVGDKILRYVAQTLVRNSRSFDLYGRWGGEEFVGALRNVDREALTTIGERLLQLMRHAYIVHEGRQLQVTVSIGATVAREGDTVESFLRRADHLMYRSKSEGRDRLTVG